MPADWLQDQIRQTKAETDKPFGVNILIISPYMKDNLQVVLDEKVSVVTFGAGNPGPFIPPLKEAGIKTMPVVASVALARRLERYSIDALIVEGTESGGHVGETTTMSLLPQVTGVVKHDRVKF